MSLLCASSETLFAHSVDISVGIQGSVWVHTSLCQSFHARPSFLSLFTCSHNCIHAHNSINPITLCLYISLNYSCNYMYSLLYCHSQAIQFLLTGVIVILDKQCILCIDHLFMGYCPHIPSHSHLWTDHCVYVQYSGSLCTRTEYMRTVLQCIYMYCRCCRCVVVSIMRGKQKPKSLSTTR